MTRRSREDVVVFEIPNVVDAESETLVGMVDYLLAGLLHVAPATLSARCIDEKKVVVWNLKTRSGESEFYRIKGGWFRTILARFGSYFMDGQIYGGEARKQIMHLSREFTVSFKMSNSHQGGLWIEVIATPDV